MEGHILDLREIPRRLMLEWLNLIIIFYVELSTKINFGILEPRRNLKNSENKVSSKNNQKNKRRFRSFIQNRKCVSISELVSHFVSPSLSSQINMIQKNSLENLLTV
jgi:hypothetical protein